MVMLKLPETVAVQRGAGLGEVIGLGIGTRTGARMNTGTSARPITRTSARAGVFTLRFWRRLLDTTETSNGIPLLLLLMIAFFLLSFGESSLYSAFPLFASELLNLTAEQVGVQFFFIGIIAVVIQGFLIKPLTNRFPEERIFMVGNGLMVIGLAVIPLAGSMTQLAVALSVMAIGKSLNTPTMTSLISQQADESDVGAVMGTAQGLSGLGRMIGPSWGGASYVCPGLCNSLRSHRRHRKRNHLDRLPAGSGIGKFGEAGRVGEASNYGGAGRAGEAGKFGEEGNRFEPRIDNLLLCRSLQKTLFLNVW